MLEVSGLKKSFGAVEVLDGVSFSIEQGETVAVIGPSGSGKSTMLRCLIGLEHADDGDVTIEGEPLMRGGRYIHEKQARRVCAKMGMVFQSFNLFPHMNALQNVMEALVHELGLSKREARERAVELLAMVGLEDKLEHFPAQLSGGQQQRVAIARALAMRPKVMLFDEVTSALDPELCGEVLNVIRRLGEAHNLTMLMVTHQMGFAREFADRVCFFHQGRIHEQGSPDELSNNPREERTREFLSAVNEAH